MEYEQLSLISGDFNDVTFIFQLFFFFINLFSISITYIQTKCCGYVTKA